ncbi:rCG24274, isoform CRA_b [Rattus norvegicus]|uniref:RCG24274, isoform CRA_b n=1 Tax=Rattus norvegicus TaxID=10116 RepID=A6KAU4_RAT|nr:rCG24274, isoform CRA_b [Rattus norvegicus]
MVKYFLGQSVLRSSWDQVFAAFWQRYPNPYSKHVLTEDIVHREVTPDQKLLSRRLLTKTNRMPRWAERLFPANVAHSVYILEDSIVDPQNQTMTTFTWNINHARLMVVEERCVYCVNSDNSGWTEIRREAWVSSSLFGVSRAVQVRGWGLGWAGPGRAGPGPGSLSNSPIILLLPGIWSCPVQKQCDQDNEGL